MTYIATKKLFYVVLLILALSFVSVTVNFSPTVQAQEDINTIEISGPDNEYTGLPLYYVNGSAATCMVKVYSESGVELFNITSTGDPYLFNYSTSSVPSVVPIYLDFLCIDDTGTTPITYHRQYWFSSSDLSMISYSVCFSPYQQSYTISFLDYTSELQSYEFIQASIEVGAKTYKVEKRPLDVQNVVGMELADNSKYDISLISDTSTYAYGNLATTGVTAIQLVLKGADFPKESLLEYPYVTFYGYRGFATPQGYIVINYNDSKAQTNSLTATITDSGGNVVYSYTASSTNSLTLNWTSAVNATIYTATVTVDHALYGEVTWSQIFANQAGDNGALFSLSFLGDWGFNTAYIIPALIVLLVAGCFSLLNAEVGAILSVIAGIVLAYMGWLPIPAGALVSGLSLAILMALVYNKRRTAYQ